MLATLPVLAAISSAVAVLCLFVGFYRLARPAGDLEDRLEQTIKRDRGQPKASMGRQVAGLARKISLNERLARQTALELTQAGLSFTVNEYVLLRLGAMLAGIVIGYLVSRNLLLGLALGMLGMQLPVFYLHRRRGQRQRRFHVQLVDTVSMLSGGVRAGVGLVQAMDLVRQEMPEPTSDEFGRVVREIGLGASLDDALEHMKERMPSDDLAMLVTVIHVQSEVGGNLAAILDNIVNTLRERVRIHQEIQTLTAQQRGTGYILAGLPFVVGGLVMAVNPGYMAPILTLKWLWMPAMAVIMVGVGFMIMNKLADIKV